MSIILLGVSQLSVADDIKKMPYEAYTELGSAYLEINDFANAMDNIDKALKYKDDYAPALMVKGLTSAMINKTDDAQKYLERAMKIEPNNLDIQNSYGMFLCESKVNREQGKKILEDLSHNLLYTSPEKVMRNLEKCVDGYENKTLYLLKAVQINPNDLNTRIRLLEVYDNYQKYNAASKLVKLLLDKWPPNVVIPAKIYDIGYRSERVLVEAGKGSDADFKFYKKQLMDNYPTSIETLRLLNDE